MACPTDTELLSRRRVQSPLGALALAGLAILAMATPLGCGSSGTNLAGPPAKILMVQGYPLRALLAQDAHLGHAFVNRTTYVLDANVSRPAAPQLAGTVEPTAIYKSYAAFARDIAAGRVP